MTLRIDLYCRVVDNFGDAGVCWRLARQLVTEHNTRVRLIIDRPEYVARLAGRGELAQIGIEVIDWSSAPADLPDVVIAAFQCRLPDTVEAAVVVDQQNSQTTAVPPVLWINLDYLSGEDWVGGVHGRPSIKAGGATEWFFLPGFTPDSGGLIRERTVCSGAANPVPADPRPSEVAPLPWLNPSAVALNVSLFCYSGQDIRGLAAALAETAARRSQPIDLLVTAGCDLADIRRQLTLADNADDLRRDNLTIRMLPWMSQHEYDRLLAGCDLNFVRGEDSWIRAIWAGKPFVWSPYRQDDGAHLAKMRAFLKQMEPAFVQPEFVVVERAMVSWAANVVAEPVALEHRANSASDAAHWATHLLTAPGISAGYRRFADALCAQPDLSHRLMAFVAQKRRLPP